MNNLEHEQQHGHPRAWMTMLLASAAALIVLFMSFAALQISVMVNNGTFSK